MKLRMLVAPLVGIALIALFFYVPWHVIATQLVPQGHLRVAAYVLLTMIALFFPAMYFGHSKHFDPARFYADIFMGITWIFFTFSAIIGVISWLISGMFSVDLRFLAAIIALALSVLMFCLGLYGGLRQPDINQQDVHIRRLDSRLDGLKVLVISDTHYGPVGRVRWTKKLVERMNAQKPDVALFVGDIADGSAAQRTPAATELSKIDAPYRGYVTGNHEYYEGVHEWEELMESLGWSVLHNKNFTVTRNGAELTVAGINDLTANTMDQDGGGANILTALEGVNRANPIILMAHQPKQITDAIDEQLDLQVSGHTHGGQIWPFMYLIPLDQPLVQGLKDFNGTQLFVTRGAGAWGPPLRLFAPSEVNILTLRA